MSLTVIHIISSIQQINFGVFNAVTSTFEQLKGGKVKSVLAHPSLANEYELPQIALISLGVGFDDAIQSIEAADVLIDGNTTLFVSHGVWKLPTKLGAYFKAKGYPWMVVPHGMLEPWSMGNRWFFKWPYYLFFEKSKLKKADCLVGVSAVETNNLKKQFKKVIHIPNGITPYEDAMQKPEYPITFLFLSRLHHKKGVLPLAEAWVHSNLNNHADFKLIIAGPDEGEGIQLNKMCQQSENIQLVGSQYGKDKAVLLKNAHFFLLPSFSEGFPTAVLEAMTYGCVPLISQGCNFPEAFEANVAIEAPPKAATLKTTLEMVANWSLEDCINKGKAAKTFVDNHYALANIAQQQLALYQKLVKHHASTRQ